VDVARLDDVELEAEPRRRGHRLDGVGGQAAAVGQLEGGDASVLVVEVQADLAGQPDARDRAVAAQSVGGELIAGAGHDRPRVAIDLVGEGAPADLAEEALAARELDLVAAAAQAVAAQLVADPEGERARPGDVDLDAERVAGAGGGRSTEHRADGPVEPPAPLHRLGAGHRATGDLLAGTG
jgi:hypothetical protein